MRKPEYTPLVEAVFRGSLKDVASILEAGANVDARDDDGRTALMHAAIDGLADLVRVLIRGGSDVNAQDASEFSALHFAAQDHHESVVRLLLESGATVDIRDSFGNTPLWRAVFEWREGRDAVVNLLLAHGANKTLKNYHDVPPLELAQDKKLNL